MQKGTDFQNRNISSDMRDKMFNRATKKNKNHTQKVQKSIKNKSKLQQEP